MNLPALCIRRPVFTVMLIALPVVVGLISLLRVGVELYPDVEFPLVVVSTSRPGASVEEMETGVTKVVEDAINTISGIEELRSTTTEGQSTVTIMFVLSKDRDVAQNEVQGKVNTILARLPTGTQTPIVDKFDVDASPIMSVALSGRRSMRELTDVARRQVADNLSSLRGVGSVNVAGGRRRAINITIDTAKLESYGLSIETVRAALAGQNLELPGGRVDQERRELVLRTMGRVADPARFADIVVASAGGQPIRIADLGGADAVVDGFEEPRSIARLDGDNAVTLVVHKQSGANTVEVIHRIKDRLDELGRTLHREGYGDIRIQPIRDQSVFIEASLHEVEVHLVLGAFLVVLTIMLFLRDWRATIIAGLAIPISIICVFPFMWLFGLTLNNITLIGLVLVIGIVIDDAVIVMENIFRWMEEERLPPMEAALKGTQEIALAVVATTLSLAVIFLPIAFMQGAVGMFLRSFGIVCAVAVLASMAVSFTLTVMLSSRFLRLAKRKRAGDGKSRRPGLFARLVERPYLVVLRWAMRHCFAVVAMTAAVTASMFPLPFLRYPGLVRLVGFNFIPKDDQSEFEIAYTTPQGWSLQRTSDVAGVIERRLQAMPEVTHVLSEIGDTSGRQARGQGSVTRGAIYVRLVDLERRAAPFTQFQIMDRARAMMRDYPDLRSSVQLPAAISGGGTNADVEYVLSGPDLDRLDEYAGRIVARLRETRGFVDVDTTLAARTPELRVNVDRDRAADLGVSVQAIAATLRVLVGGEIVSDFKDQAAGEQYDVWLRAEGTERGDAAAVANLTIPSAKAGLVRLSNVATAEESIGPSQIDRSQRRRTISIVANLAGLASYEAAKLFERAFAELDAPPVYTFTASGHARSEAEAVTAFLLSFLLSFIFMYMILAAQFESFVQPVAILVALPVTLPFALLSLWLLGQPLTLFSVLGLFLLFGIVKKNGILQIDYTNVLRRRAAADAAIVPALYQGRTRLWAILEANRVRLRPILMTTLILVTAMIPVALGTGPGAASRADMAKVIVGGQTLSLLLSLVVTPVAYSLFDDIALWFRRPAAVTSPLPAAGSR